MTTIKEKTILYKSLKRSKRALDKKLEELREVILAEDKESLRSYGLEPQVRDLTTYDSFRVQDLMVQKNIPYQEYTQLKIDPSKIEQLYLDGKLTDDDLRYIREPKYVTALVEVENVQAQEVH